MIKKIISFLRLLKYVKIIFNNPPKKKIFIFDNSDIFSLKESILKNLDHFIYEDRTHLITKIYISFEILKIVFDYYKFGFKTAYSIAIIKIVDPKIVLTWIHNSENFSNVAKILHNQFNFLAIQNASYFYRVNEALYLKKKYNIQMKSFYIPHLLCYSNYDKKNYKKNSQIRIGKFNVVGSLRLDNFKRRIKEKKFFPTKNRYDICLLSEVGAWELDDKSLDFKFAKLIKFVIKYCKEENKKLIFALKRQKKIKNIAPQSTYVIKGFYNEQKWYKKFFDKDEYNFLKKRFKYQYPYSSYEAAYESKIIIAGMSTMLREMYSQKKKILACNFTSNKVYDFPIKGISSINFECEYRYFKKRLDRILNLSNKKYFKEANFKKDDDLILNKKDKTTKKILDIIQNYIKKNDKKISY